MFVRKTSDSSHPSSSGLIVQGPRRTRSTAQLSRIGAPATRFAPPYLAAKFGRLSGHDGISGCADSDPDGIRGGPSPSSTVPAFTLVRRFKGETFSRDLRYRPRRASLSSPVATTDSARTPASETVQSVASNPILCRGSPSKRGDRALVGPNASGKTALLRALNAVSQTCH
jgi:hypothetical protein